MPNPAERDTTHVLVLGGYGFFGRRLVERLTLHADLVITIAGRQIQAAEKLASALGAPGHAPIFCLETDTTDRDRLRETLLECPAQIVINTCGPFQQRDYLVAQTCIEQGKHYIDLADGRDFVSGIVALDKAARDRNVLVVSGASSVPALSAAAVDQLASTLKQVLAIDIGISPGNRTERGLATVQAILGYCGAPVGGWKNESRIAITGWGTHWSYDYPAPIGRRWLSPCDVPDLTLFPARYAGVRDVRFGAGLELRSLHAGMLLMAIARRIGLVRDWSSHARLLKRLSDLFLRFGSDAGAMHVCVDGADAENKLQRRTWTLVADHGDGPYVPTLAAAALVRGLADRRITRRGATPCVGLLTLQDFERETAGLSIRMTTGVPA